MMNIPVFFHEDYKAYRLAGNLLMNYIDMPERFSYTDGQ